MTKNELLALANKGRTEINGYPLEVIITKCCGDPWIEINVEPLSPLHRPLILGQKWLEYVTEEECAELPEWLDRYKREAEEFCKQAQTVVKATLNQDGTYTFVDVPETVKEDFKDYPSHLEKWLNEKHYINFIDKEQKYWYAPGHFTLEIDGVKYVPHWSYWLNCAYYESTEQIFFKQAKD